MLFLSMQARLMRKKYNKNDYMVIRAVGIFHVIIKHSDQVMYFTPNISDGQSNSKLQDKFI